ncbi:hypothetical protein AB0D91_48940 [Streptomyces canus]|uniref:hypothetical protein n=1 Tax=Streptomyces canus TaxID=58343 RepID=UPI0034048C7F
MATNAVRQVGGPVALRPVREDMPLCEVAVAGKHQPRLRRASTTDGGGRGLFPVAQPTMRWGCPYGRTGKTVRTEQLTARTDAAMWDRRVLAT